MEEVITPLSRLDVTQESIKLIRNETAKGATYYTWEIKILATDVERLSNLDKELIKKFPRLENGN